MVVQARRHSSGAFAVRDPDITQMKGYPWKVVYARPWMPYFESQQLRDCDVAEWESWPEPIATPDTTAVVLELPSVDPPTMPDRYAHCGYCGLKKPYSDTITYGTTIHVCIRKGATVTAIWKPFHYRRDIAA